MASQKASRTYSYIPGSFLRVGGGVCPFDHFFAFPGTEIQNATRGMEATRQGGGGEKCWAK